MRSEPSRWRCSSALGIASTRRRSGSPVRARRVSSIGMLESSADATIPRPCPPSSSRAPPASSAVGRLRPCSTPATGSSPSCARGVPANSSLERLPAGCARPLEIAHRRCDQARDAAGRRWTASTPSCTSSPSRATTAAAPTSDSINTEGTRAVVEAMKAAGVRRLVHMGALGVADDPTLHYASSKAKAEALVAASGLDWTILKPSLQFGPGDGFFNIIADLVRLSPGIVPVPGNGGSRFQPIHGGDVARVVVAAFADDPTTIGGVVRAGRPALLDLSRDHARGPARAWASAGSIVPMPVPLIRLVAGTRRGPPPAVPGRDRPAAPARLDNIGPLDLDPDAVRVRAAADGGRAGLPSARSARPAAGAMLSR